MWALRLADRCSARNLLAFANMSMRMMKEEYTYKMKYTTLETACDSIRDVMLVALSA